MTWHEFFQIFLSSCPAGDLIKGGDWPQQDLEMMMTCFFDKISYEKTGILLLMVQIPTNGLLDV